MEPISWQDFERELARCLEELLGEDACLIIDAGERYVQFALLDDRGVRTEASSNEFLLGGPGRIADRDVAAMAALGWRLPDRPAPERGVKGPPGGSPNFYLDLEPPVDLRALAALAVATLRLVFEVPVVSDLRYDAFRQTGGRLLFPDLGLGLSVST